MRLALLLLAAVLACGCPHNGSKPPSKDPTLQEVVEHLTSARDALTSFRADTTMDYWLGDQRAKGEVLVMGKAGHKIRFAALSPAGGSTLAEMACDGTSFVYVDYQNNCALTGPCDARSVAVFFHLELDPDDFVHLALGTPPVIKDPTGKVTWDGSRGAEKVELAGGGATQKLSIDVKDNRWDVLDSELVGGDGKVVWSVANTDFGKVTGSGERRVPGKTRFKEPAGGQDLLVEWGDQHEVNIELDDAKFALVPPAGLPACGQKASAPGTAAPKP